MDDLTFQSAKSLARAIREKSVSAREVVEAHLRRIEEVNPVLNAVVQLAAERAESEARELDDALARGELRGPLHGVPITIKDSFDTEGIISTGGTLGRAAFVPEQRRDAGGAAARRGRGAAGQDQHAGADDGGRDGQPGVRAHQQSVRRVPHAGRQQRRRRGHHIGRRLAARPGHRHRRQHPFPVPLLRHRGPQAHLRAGAPHRPYHRIRHGRRAVADGCRPDGALRRGPGAGVSHHRRAGLPRPSHGADADWRPGRRGPGRAARGVLYRVAGGVGVAGDGAGGARCCGRSRRRGGDHCGGGAGSARCRRGALDVVHRLGQLGLGATGCSSVSGRRGSTPG